MAALLVRWQDAGCGSSSLQLCSLCETAFGNASVASDAVAATLTVSSPATGLSGMYSARHGRSSGSSSGLLSRWYDQLAAIRPRTWLIVLSSVFVFLVVMNLAFLYFPDSASLQKYLPLPVAAYVNPGSQSPFKPPTPPPVINAAPPVPPPVSAIPASPQPPHSTVALNATSNNRWKQPASTRCDKQFGNGFGETSQLCLQSAAATSSLVCHHNPLTVSTVCEGSNVRIRNTRMEVSRGDEEIASVRGRTEEKEFPVYKPGALAVDCQQPQPAPAMQYPVYRDHIAGMFGSIEYGPFGGSAGEKCLEEVDEAIILTRYEYANLYHTMTDLYNTYQAMQMFAQSARPPLVLFMDGHSKGLMDTVWPTLFSPNVRYIMHMPATLCIRHAVFVSPGYGSALSPSMFTGDSASCVAHPLVMDFAAFVQRKYRLGQEDSNEKVVVKDVTGQLVELAGNDDAQPLVSFIVRRSYLSHPRVKLDATERTMRDELPTLKAIQEALAAYAIRFHAFDFTQLPLHTQLNVLYHSTLLSGIHGAALSYILLLPQHVSLLELMPASYAAREHFRYFAVWSGHEYDALRLTDGGSSGFTVDREAMVSAIAEMIGNGDAASPDQAVVAAVHGGGDEEDAARRAVGQRKKVEFSKITQRKPSQRGDGQERGNT